MRVAASGGSCETLTSDGDDRRPMHRFPQILPGGKTVLFGIASTEGAEESQIALLDLASQAASRFSINAARRRAICRPATSFTSAVRSMFAVPFDLDRRQDDRARSAGVRRRALGSAEWRRRLHRVRIRHARLHVGGNGPSHAGVGRRRRPSPTIAAPAREYGGVSISPDGRRAATFLTRGGAGIFIVDLERGTLSRISERGSFPLWTPDGAQIIYSRIGELLRVPADGSGAPELLATEAFATVNSISPDGRDTRVYRRLVRRRQVPARHQAARTRRRLSIERAVHQAVNHNESDAQIFARWEVDGVCVR